MSSPFAIPPCPGGRPPRPEGTLRIPPILPVTNAFLSIIIACTWRHRQPNTPTTHKDRSREVWGWWWGRTNKLPVRYRSTASRAQFGSCGKRNDPHTRVRWGRGLPENDLGYGCRVNQQAKKQAFRDKQIKHVRITNLGSHEETEMKPTDYAKLTCIRNPCTIAFSEPTSSLKRSPSVVSASSCLLPCDSRAADRVTKDSRKPTKDPSTVVLKLSGATTYLLILGPYCCRLQGAECGEVKWE